MTTPVVENVVSLIDHLDFDITCAGIRQGTNHNECSNRAVYLISYNCGCDTVKCVECTNRLKVVIKEWQARRSMEWGVCSHCGNSRNDNELTINPL